MGSGEQGAGRGLAKSKCQQRVCHRQRRRGTKFRNEVMLIASHFVSERAPPYIQLEPLLKLAVARQRRGVGGVEELMVKSQPAAQTHD